MEFYVSILDPDDVELENYYSQERSGELTFETGKAGEYTFHFSGKWVTIDIYLYELTETTRTTYPYGPALFLGLLLLVGGASSGILGALKNKNQDT